MWRNEKDFVVVSISEDLLKAAHLRGAAAHQTALGFVRESLEGVDEIGWTEKVQGVLQRFGVKNPKALCVIPSNIITTKNIEIPSLDEEEIRSIIDLQAGRHTPYSREEILIGYVSIGIFQRNYTKVLLVIANRDVVKKRLDACEAAGMRIEKVLFAPECVAAFYADLLGVQPDDSPVGIIDVTYNTTDFIIEHNQTVATSRNIPIGIRHLLENEAKAKKSLIGELLKSLEIYHSEDINKPLGRYMLTTDVPIVKQLQPDLQKQLNADIEIVPYSGKIAVAKDSPDMTENMQDDSFAQLVSAAHLVHKNFQVDLMPDEIKNQRAIEEKGKQVIIAGLLTMILLVLVCGFFYVKIYFRNLYLEKLQREFAIKQYLVVQLDKIAHRTQIIKEFFASRMASLDVVNELYEIIPEEMYLQNIFMNEDGVINIQGVSESMSTVFDVVKALEDSPLFKSVKTRSTTAKKDRGKDAAAFDIVFKLESASDDVVVDAETGADNGTGEGTE